MPVPCLCCLADIGDDEISEGLQCGHMFHNECIRRYMEVKEIENIKDLACPTCKLSGWDVDRLEVDRCGEAQADHERTPETAEVARNC